MKKIAMFLFALAITSLACTVVVSPAAPENPTEFAQITYQYETTEGVTNFVFLVERLQAFATSLVIGVEDSKTTETLLAQTSANPYAGFTLGLKHPGNDDIVVSGETDETGHLSLSIQSPDPLVKLGNWYCEEVASWTAGVNSQGLTSHGGLLVCQR